MYLDFSGSKLCIMLVSRPPTMIMRAHPSCQNLVGRVSEANGVKKCLPSSIEDHLSGPLSGTFYRFVTWNSWVLLGAWWELGEVGRGGWLSICASPGNFRIRSLMNWRREELKQQNQPSSSISDALAQIWITTAWDLNPNFSIVFFAKSISGALQ